MAKKPKAEKKSGRPSKKSIMENEVSKWEKRIKRAEMIQKNWRRDGREFMMFIEGSQWPRSRDKQTPDIQWSKTTANRMAPLIQGMMAAVVFRNPVISQKPMRAGEEAARKARVNAALLNYSNREEKTDDAYTLATFEAFTYGCGFIEEDFNNERGGPRGRWRSAEDVIVDPDSNTTVESASWMGYKFTMDVKVAKKTFNDKTITADAGSPMEEPTEASRVRSVGRVDLGTGQTETPSVDRVTLYRIYVRGDDPVIEDANIADRDNKTEFGENRVLVIDLNNGKILDDRRWPYVIDHDEFPITLFRAHLRPGALLPYSPLKPVKELQINYNWAMTYLITQMRRTSQRKWLVDGKMFDDNQLDALSSQEMDEIIEVNGASPNAIQPLDLGSLSQAPLQMLTTMKNEMDEISGFTEIFGGLRSARSATEAAIRDERAQTAVSLMQKNIEKAMTEVERHKLQIAMSIMNTQEVIDLVGSDLVEDFEIDPTGEPIKVANYWDEELSPAQIRRESRIVLEPGSMRKVNRDQEVADTQALMSQAFNLIGQLVQAGVEIDAEALLEYGNAFLRRMADKMGWIELDQFLVPPEAVSLQPAVRTAEEARKVAEEQVTAASEAAGQAQAAAQQAQANAVGAAGAAQGNIPPQVLELLQSQGGV